MAEKGGNLTVAASVCGTEGDPQDVELQRKLLADAGVVTFTSSAKATLFCLELLSEAKESKGAGKTT